MHRSFALWDVAGR